MSRLPRFLSLLSAVLLFAATGLALAQEAGSEAVAALGRLNGVALACSQPALNARLREIIVNTAPKTRAVGEAFEQATHAAYLAHLQQGAACPDGKTLSEQVAAGEAALQQAFRKAP